MILNLNKLQLECSKCGYSKLKKNIKIINQFTVSEIRCDSCGEKQVYLLPTDNHSAVIYPFSFDPKTFTHNGELNDYTQLLLKNYKKKLNNVKTTIEFFGEKKKEKCLIVNTLDNAYGHSLFKIFGLINIFKNHHKEYDIIVLTFPQFSYMIPEEFNKIIINKSFNEMNIYTNISNLIKKITNKYKEVEIAINSTYPLERNKIKKYFFNEYIKETNQKKIVYIYRKEYKRSWGVFLEKRRVKALFKKLKSKYSNEYEFYIIGDYDGGDFEEYIIDKRVKKYNKKSDVEWISILNEAELVIGVHGSHMILPSLLAKKVLDLLPRFKYSHIGEDIFVENMQTNLLMKKIQFIRGDSFLFNLSVNKVFEILVNQIASSKRQKYFNEFSILIENNYEDSFYSFINREDKSEVFQPIMIKFMKFINSLF